MGRAGVMGSIHSSASICCSRARLEWVEAARPIHRSGGGEIGGADPLALPVRFAWVWLAGAGRG